MNQIQNQEARKLRISIQNSWWAVSSILSVVLCSKYQIDRVRVAVECVSVECFLSVRLFDVGRKFEERSGISFELEVRRSCQ